MSKVLKKKNNFSIIAILIIAVFAFAIYNTFKFLKIGSLLEFQNVIYEVQNHENGYIMLLMAFALILFQVIINPVTLFLLGYIIIKFIYNLTNLKHRMHPKFKIEYFRDDLSNVSPGIVSFLVDFKINVDRDISAHILKLMLDGYIEDKNGKYIVTNKDQNYLLDSDKVVLSLVKSNFNDTTLLDEYRKSIIKDCTSIGYIKANNQKKKLIFMFLIPYITFSLIFLCATFMEHIFNFNSVLGFVLLGILFLLILATSFCFPWGILIYIFILFKYGSYRRTKEGNILLEQIMGLKNYLEDFSNLDQSNSKELILREYYLVYAIVLEINDQVHDDVLNKIQKQMK